MNIVNKDLSWGNCIGFVNNTSEDSILGYNGNGWGWWTYSKADNEGFIHNFKNFGTKPEKFKGGDKIRVVIDCGDKSVTYYKNEEFIGTPFLRDDIAADEIWPAITLCGDLDRVTISR